VTGFSLLGHAREMALGHTAAGIEPVSLEIDHSRIEYLPGAIQCATDPANTSGGLRNNRDFIGDCVTFADSVPPEFHLLLFDPQTSGGLLVAIAEEAAESALGALARRGASARRIGRVLGKRSSLIQVV